MKFGYFTLMDNPPAHGARHRDPNRFFHEVMEEAISAEEIGLCHHPIAVGEQVCTLDQVSGGRAVSSAGRGYGRREYEAFGIPFEESRERFARGR